MSQPSIQPMRERPQLLQIGPVPEALEQLLDADYQRVPLWTQTNRAQFLSQHDGAFVAGLTMSRHGCPADAMACLRGRALVCFGVGFEGIDLAAAARYQVAVSTTPDVLTDCVADLAFALILASARQVVAASRFVQQGHWANGPFATATKVSGKRLGLLGLGRIGAAIARRASGFDMPVRYHTRSAKPGVAWAHEPDLLELAEWCDFLVVACTGGPNTRHLVSAPVLQALGPQGFLINIARGSVVDEDALIAAINSQSIAGAGLDVLTDEPHVSAALLNNDRVLILPHVAASTHETRAAVAQLVVDNLTAFLQTGRVLTPPVERLHKRATPSISLENFINHDKDVAGSSCSLSPLGRGRG